MLKSSSFEWRAGLSDTILKGTLHSSNLGTFWLKIEQFWPFEEISIFSNSSHLEWRAGLSENSQFTILCLHSSNLGTFWLKIERDPPRDHPCQVWFNLVQRFQRRRFKCDLLSKYASWLEEGAICIIGIYRLKEKFHRKIRNIS